MSTLKRGPRTVTRFADQIYSRAGGRDRLADVYQPEGDGPFPAILFLHGGGWRFGDRRLAPDLARHFGAYGFVMVSIDYRLSGEAQFPAAVIDTVCAVRWMKAHARNFQIDPHRIGLLGSSAGAHLALLAAFAPEAFASDEWAEQDARVAALVDGYGPSDFLQADAHRDPDALPGCDAESALIPDPLPSSDPTSMESIFLGAPINDVPERVAAANPLTYASGATCPVLILHGDCDAHVPLHQSRLVYDGLAATGADVTFVEISGLGHGFLNRSDLDAGGSHKVRIYHGRTPERVEEGHVEIWTMIRSFFAKALR
jgi:acetyl esterase/lipase